MYFSSKYRPVLFLYNILTYVADFHLRIIALFNEKIALGVRGRSRTFKQLKIHIADSDKVIWAHCASLGEYEQGLPVFERLKELHPDHKFVLSFFSPSGYENKKNAPIADVVVYLPLDTKRNAIRFLNAVHPNLVLFVKYEIWPNYLKHLKNRAIWTILISANFRKDQSYFKFTGKWMLAALKSFDHIFVQNKSSKKLLEDHGITNVTISGDTRFDRVLKQLTTDNHLAFIERFKQNKLCIVAGSTWPGDEALLIDFINKSEVSIKYVIAPHNIKSKQIGELKAAITKSTVLYSEMNEQDLSNFDVLILDTIGLLAKTYAYANIAYVGGAMGTTGLHNTLEAAVFGVPIIIGKNYEKFPEAKDMIDLGGLFAVSNQSDFNEVLHKLISGDKDLKSLGKKNYDYIKKNEGAVIQILDYLRK